MKNFDAIIIGFGKGGKTLADDLAKQGKQVALIEQSNEMYGGTCINVGCIPSKSLITNALANQRGLPNNYKGRAILYRQAILEKRQLVAMLRKKNYDKLANLENITIYNGQARFQNKHEIIIRSNKETFIIRGEQIFINTGATTIIPNIPGLSECPIAYTSETLMNLEHLPRKLLIIGGGYIGLEFASMYASFGTEVTVFEGSGIFLSKEDRDVAEHIKQALEAKGIQFKLGATVQSIQAENSSSAYLTYSLAEENYQEKTDAILVAVGRKPNTADLNLAATGVEMSARGAVLTNEWLQTSQAHILAMGDVVGGLQFTYISLDDYRIIKGQLEGKSAYSTAVRKNVPYSVFIDPPFSRVGLSETEAIAAGHQFRILQMPVASIPKAQVLKHPVGFLKAIIDTKNNQILGAVMFCEESYEAINIIKLAMDLQADYTVLRDQIFTHPTISEALNDLFSL